MQKFKFDFLENEFWADWVARFNFYFQNLTKYFHGIFFNVYRNVRGKTRY